MQELVRTKKVVRLSVILECLLACTSVVHCCSQDTPKKDVLEHADHIMPMKSCKTSLKSSASLTKLMSANLITIIFYSLLHYKFI